MPSAARPAKSAPSLSAETQVKQFIAKFDPRVQRLIRSCRAAMRKRMPAANELVYDNYNFFVIGYSSTDRASDCIVSLASDMHGVTLFFYYGARLPDPAKILKGSGNQVRSIRLESAATLARLEVEALLCEAIAYGKNPLPETGRGRAFVKAIVAKQRPRR
jgi:hypothetical protein